MSGSRLGIVLPMPAPFPPDPESLRKWFEAEGAERLPGLLGVEIVELEERRCRLRCDVTPRHLAPNGYLHAAAVIALADTAAGYGCVASLPPGANGFTTIELKSNHLGTLLEGGMTAEATLLHGGRTTQVWDAVVQAEESGRRLAVFRCTQLIVYAEPGVTRPGPG